MTLNDWLSLSALGIVFLGMAYPLARRAVRRKVIGLAIRRERKEVRRMAATAKAETSQVRADSTFENVLFNHQPPRQEAASRAPLSAGRQNIEVCVSQETPFGAVTRPWSPPIPRHAQSMLWADLHRFAPGADRQHDPRGAFLGEEPPLAFLCPGCDLEQPPLNGRDRTCGYCGLKIRLHGLRVFWWREPTTVEPWEPFR